MSDKLYDVCIIGAGASGLIAAIESSRRGLSVVVIDKNKKPLLKLYATGNGRCNLTNNEWDDHSYYGNEFVDEVFESLFRETGLRQRSFITSYFKNLGLETVNKHDYIYPASLQASSVAWTLLDTASYYGVEIIDKCKVTDISSNGDIYSIFTSLGMINSRNIILSAGGLSQPKLGAASEEDLTFLFKRLGLTYNAFLPSLVPLICKDAEENSWSDSGISGVRTEAVITIDGHSETGELQITDYGISGIVIFNMSYYAYPGAEIYINLIPKKSRESFIEHLKNTKSHFPERKLITFLNGLLNDKLAFYILKKYYGEMAKDLKLKDITDIGMDGIYDELSSWTLKIKDMMTYDISQATRGGVIVDQINPLNMSIYKKSTLYVTGESIDVIGRCGGYNLTFAFITGFLAGRSVKI